MALFGKKKNINFKAHVNIKEMHVRETNERLNRSLYCRAQEAKR